MSSQINPKQAPSLAQGIYTVNGNIEDYTIFLKNKLFDAKAQSSVLKTSTLALLM